MINRLPRWFKQEIPDEAGLKISGLLSEFGVHTVCRQAQCPNINRCFKDKHCTFMILGKICTRNCGFCNVTKSEGKPIFLDENEPFRISRVVETLGLNYVVITSVTRDDMSDGGASHFAKTLKLIQGVNRNIKAEVLIPDFQGKIASLECILQARPFVVGHNLETVSRLYDELRPQADYRRSLNTLGRIKKISPGVLTKSSLMLGFGETKQEVVNALQDLRKQDCDILTLGQYLAPSTEHYPAKEFIDIEQFQEYEKISIGMGFKAVLSGPLVRSSYKAEEVSKELQLTPHLLNNHEFV
ncbi:MAG: lipoyl synthase [Omnitrophica WOR_2 bacterium RBG_13_44_8b]|nr:MAG: lipoyl synthase [Omnitrophica WOR_2 bacterium RBG_13_44_8b]